MNAEPGSARVQRTGCSTLTELAQQDAAGGAQAVVDAGGVAAVVAAMELAEVEGIDLVLIEDSTMGFQVLANAQVSREQQMAEQIAARRVLWRESAIDISDELIVRMNNDYAASTGGR